MNAVGPEPPPPSPQFAKLEPIPKKKRMDKRVSIALGMESLKIPQGMSLRASSTKIATKPKDQPLSASFLRKAEEMFQVSHGKHSQKVFKSQDAIEEEQHRQALENRFIIHPLSTFRWYWDMIMVFALLMTMFYIPINIAFYTDDYAVHWKVMNLMLDCIFLMDIVLNFRTGFVDSATDEIILSSNKIAKHYVMSWFFIDILCSIPFDYIYALFHPEITAGSIKAMSLLRALRLTKLLSLLRIFRMARLLRYIHKIEELLEIEGSVIRIANLIMLILVFSHWNGCMQYFFAFMDDFPHDSWVALTKLQYSNVTVFAKYTGSVFRAMSHMLSIGYGNLGPPVNVADTWVTMISMLAGATFYALFIGHMSSLLMTLDSSGRLYNEKLQQVKEYMKYRRVPLDTQKRVLGYYEHKYQRKFFDEDAVLFEPHMSHSIRQEILFHNCRNLVEKVPFLQNGPPEFLSDVIMKLKFEVFLPGDIIVQSGKRGFTMYFIDHGKVDVILDNDEVVNKLGDGAHFGEIALLFDERRVASVIASEISDIFCLTRDDFNSVLSDYPKMRKNMERVARERLAEISNTSSSPAVKGGSTIAEGKEESSIVNVEVRVENADPSSDEEDAPTTNIYEIPLTSRRTSLVQTVIVRRPEEEKDKLV